VTFNCLQAHLGATSLPHSWLSITGQRFGKRDKRGSYERIQGQGSLGLGRGRFGPPPAHVSRRWALTGMNGHGTQTPTAGHRGVSFPTKPEIRGSPALASKHGSREFYT